MNKEMAITPSKPRGDSCLRRKGSVIYTHAHKGEFRKAE